MLECDAIELRALESSNFGRRTQLAGFCDLLGKFCSNNVHRRVIAFARCQRHVFKIGVKRHG